MGWLTYLFGLMVLLTGVPAFWQLRFGLGLCGTLAPALAYMAAGGATSALRDREVTAWGTVILAVIMIGLAFLWVNWMGWHLLIFHHDISGNVEILASVVIGGLFGTNRNLNPPSHLG